MVVTKQDLMWKKFSNFKFHIKYNYNDVWNSFEKIGALIRMFLYYYSSSFSMSFIELNSTLRSTTKVILRFTTN